MLKAVLVRIVASVVCFSGLGVPLWGQESGPVGGFQSFGFSSSFSPNSSHILIAASQQRRIVTLGVEYTRLLRLGRRFRLDYEGSFMPLFEETDPTFTGLTFTLHGQTTFAHQPPVRVVNVVRVPVGLAFAANGVASPIYSVFGQQNTYAAALSPLGARISALPRSRLQPSFAVDLGFVVSSRDIPVDQSDQFNYMFSFGPGVQFFTGPQASWRLEYIYRHTSNAHQGYQNPGVDQGVFRLTLSRHR